MAIQPDFAGAHGNLAFALFSTGKIDEGIVESEKALEINPRLPFVLNKLAWVLATDPDASVRNGTRAVELAQFANQISGGESPTLLSTLAAAYAETGQFPEAITNAQHARQIALTQNDSASAATFQAQIKLYQSGLPLRDNSLTNAPAK
ncbi:MAG TPA: hypothetical protein VMB22_00270 [Verrucomicrobiae bacterium]|nr:hypothetical protein [Verrucomicrobiae bacterium]